MQSADQPRLRPSNRLTQLDGLRGLAIAAVIAHHFYKVPLLWMGVDAFFVLSGFLITGRLRAARHGSLRDYFRDFYRKRAHRLLPSYLLLLLATALLFGSAWLRHWYLYLGLMNLPAFAHDAHPYHLVILWSLAVEEQFYLLWPFAVYLLPRRHLIAACVALMALAPVFRVLLTPVLNDPLLLYAQLACRMDLLASGALIALLWERPANGSRRLARRGPFIAAGGVIALGASVRFAHFGVMVNRPLNNVVLYECTLAISVGLLLWMLAGTRGSALLTARPLVFLGRISYTVYLFHVFFYFVVYRYLPVRYVAPVAIAATLAWASASWFLLEGPMIRRAQKPAHIPGELSRNATTH